MAKRGVPEHPKTRKLARLLSTERWAAVGLLECLWHWCSRFAVTGEIPYDAAEIADGINYTGDPEELLNALIDCGWLDRCECGKLYIHDIEDHADNTWKATLKRQGKDFSRCNHTESQLNHNGITTKSQRSNEPPNLTIPNQTKPTAERKTQIDEIWEAYPKRDGLRKREGRGCIEARLLLEKIPPEELLAGTKRYADYCTARGDPQFIMSPERFYDFENALWRDEWKPPKPDGRETARYSY